MWACRIGEQRDVPEGNTVWLTARALRLALADRVLTAGELRVPRLATVDLRGRRVLDVVPRGKHLLMRFDDDLTLHSHLRMDGNWRVLRRTRAIGFGGDQVRAVLSTSECTAVGRRVHDLALVATAQEDSLVGHLGPDLLGADWDAAEAVRRLAADPQRAIGEALIDQRNLAGAGNVYKSETCFLRGLSPWTPVSEVAELPAVVDLVHRLLTANRERYDHVTTGDSRPGRRVWVFDRVGLPCLRCATPIRAGWLGPDDAPAYRRITYWCPRCQAGPAPAESPAPGAPAARPARRRDRRVPG